MKRETVVTYMSTWTKEGKTCHVHSERKAGDRTAKFWFRGWNPFPCMYMTSTATCVGNWLNSNGWKRIPNDRINIIDDDIDETTGEILNHSVLVYNFIPTRESEPATESIIDMVKAGKRTMAIKKYRELIGCSLKSAVNTVDAIMMDIAKVNL